VTSILSAAMKCLCANEAFSETSEAMLISSLCSTARLLYGFTHILARERLIRACHSVYARASIELIHRRFYAFFMR
jgi:hypothetical protein